MSPRQTVHIFGELDAFIVQNVNFTEVEVDEEDVTFQHLSY